MQVLTAAYLIELWGPFLEGFSGYSLTQSPHLTPTVCITTATATPPHFHSRVKQEDFECGFFPSVRNHHSFQRYLEGGPSLELYGITVPVQSFI